MSSEGEFNPEPGEESTDSGEQEHLSLAQVVAELADDYSGEEEASTAPTAKAQTTSKTQPAKSQPKKTALSAKTSKKTKTTQAKDDDVIEEEESVGSDISIGSEYESIGDSDDDDSDDEDSDDDQREADDGEDQEDIQVRQDATAPLVDDTRAPPSLASETVAVDVTPDPEQRMAKAWNLQRFDAAKIKTLQPGCGSTVVAGKTLEELVQRKPLRRVTAHYNPRSKILAVKTRDSEATVPETKKIVFEGIGDEHRLAFVRILVQMLESLPCRFSEFSTEDTIWIVAVAKKLLHKTVPTIRPKQVLPYVRPPNARHENMYVEGRVYGIDPDSSNDKKSWGLNFAVIPEDLREDVDIDLPAEFDWAERVKKRQGAPTKQKIDQSKLNDEKILRAKRLAQLVVATFSGFIGTQINCKERLARFQIPYKKKTRLARYGKTTWQAGPYRGFPIWYGPRQNPESNHLSVINAGIALRQDCEGALPYLFMRTHDKQYWYGPFQAMISIAEVTADPHKVWRAGAIACDEGQDAIRVGLPPELPVPCVRPDEKKHWHPCMYCNFAKLHSDLNIEEGFDYFICNECIEKIEDSAKVTFQIPRLPGEENQTLVVKSLIRAFKLEASHRGESLLPDELKGLVDQALLDLQHTEVVVDGVRDPSKRHDSYFAQVLDDNAPAVIDWRGRHFRLKAPGLDAVDPIHATQKDQTLVVGYHVPGNFAVTTYSMNAMARHRAKVIYIALFQFRCPQSEAEYLSAWAISRNIYVNSMETRLNRVQQSLRIGQPIPLNYDEIKACFRDGTRLSIIHVPVEKLWDIHTNRKSSTGSPKWRPSRWKYILAGVLEIARLNNLDGPDFRKYWLRFDPLSGEYVPRFCSEYAVLKRLTPYDFMALVYERLDRLRMHCDRHYAAEYAEHPELRPTFLPETLIFEWAQQYMPLVRMHLDKNKNSAYPNKSPAADSWDLPFSLNTNTPLNVSFGHKTHGSEMRTGYGQELPKSHGADSYNYDRSGIEVETQAKNWARWTMPNSATGAIEAQLDHLRSVTGPQIGSPLFKPGNIVFDSPILLPELDATAAPADDGFVLDDEDTAFDLGLVDGMSFPDADADDDDDDGGQKKTKAKPKKKASRKKGKTSAKKSTKGRKSTTKSAIKASEVKKTIGTSALLVPKGTNLPSAVPSLPDPSPAEEDLEPLTGRLTHGHPPRVPTRPRLDATPLRRNLSRMGNSCWCSVVLQLLHCIEPIRELFKDDNNVSCYAITGRNLKDMLHSNDEYGSLHDNFLKSIKGLFDNLDVQAGDDTSPVKQEAIRATIALSNRLRGPDAQLSGNRTEEALEFLFWMIEHIAIGMDRSLAKQNFDDPDPADNLQQLQNKREQVFKDNDYHMPVEEDADIEFEAWRAYGRTSSFVEAVYSQVVEERECPNCNSVFRKFHENSSITLMYEERSDRVDLAQLARDWANSKEDYEDATLKAKSCAHCGAPPSPKTSWAITMLPEVLFIRLDRPHKRGITELDFADPVKATHWSKVDNYEVLDMRDWQPSDKLPSSTSDDYLHSSEDDYVLVAVLVHIVKLPYHYVLDVVEPATGRWIQYDDLKSQPSYVDLKAHLEQPDTYPIAFVYKLKNEVWPSERVAEDAMSGIDLGGVDMNPLQTEEDPMPGIEIGDETIQQVSTHAGQERSESPLFFPDKEHDGLVRIARSSPFFAGGTPNPESRRPSPASSPYAGIRASRSPRTRSVSHGLTEMENLTEMDTISRMLLEAADRRRRSRSASYMLTPTPYRFGSPAQRMSTRSPAHPRSRLSPALFSPFGHPPTPSQFGPAQRMSTRPPAQPRPRPSPSTFSQFGYPPTPSQGGTVPVPIPMPFAADPTPNVSADASAARIEELETELDKLEARFFARSNVLQEALRTITNEREIHLGPHRVWQDARVRMIVDYTLSVRAFEDERQYLMELAENLKDRSIDLLPTVKARSLESRARAKISEAEEMMRTVSSFNDALIDDHRAVLKDHTTLDKERADFEAEKLALAEQRKAITEQVAALEAERLEFNKEKIGFKNQKRSVMPASTTTGASTQEAFRDQLEDVLNDAGEISFKELLVTTLKSVNVEEIPLAVEALLDRAEEDASTGNTRTGYDAVLGSILGKINISSVSDAIQILASRLGGAFENERTSHAITRRERDAFMGRRLSSSSSSSSSPPSTRPSRPAPPRKPDAFKGRPQRSPSFSPPSPPPAPASQPIVVRSHTPQIGQSGPDTTVLESREHRRGSGKRAISSKGEFLPSDLPGPDQKRSRPAITDDHFKQPSVKPTDSRLLSHLSPQQGSFSHPLPSSTAQSHAAKQDSGITFGQPSGISRIHDPFGIPSRQYSAGTGSLNQTSGFGSAAFARQPLKGMFGQANTRSALVRQSSILASLASIPKPMTVGGNSTAPFLTPTAPQAQTGDPKRPLPATPASSKPPVSTTSPAKLPGSKLTSPAKLPVSKSTTLPGRSRLPVSGLTTSSLTPRPKTSATMRKDPHTEPRTRSSRTLGATRVTKTPASSVGTRSQGTIRTPAPSTVRTTRSQALSTSPTKQPRPARSRSPTKSQASSDLVPCPRLHTHGCRKTFPSLAAADRHASEHDGDSPFLCPFREDRDCNKLFSSPGAADAHAELHRQRQRRTRCHLSHICFAEFETREELAEHDDGHSDGSIYCPFCGSGITFADCPTLLRHLIRSHESSTPSHVNQERILEKRSDRPDTKQCQYLVKEKGFAEEKARWRNADDVRFELVYGFEAHACEDHAVEQMDWEKQFDDQEAGAGAAP